MNRASRRRLNRQLLKQNDPSAVTHLRDAVAKNSQLLELTAQLSIERDAMSEALRMLRAKLPDDALTPEERRFIDPLMPERAPDADAA